MLFLQKIKEIGNGLQSGILLLIRLYWGAQFALTGFGKLFHLSDASSFFQMIALPFPTFTAAIIGSIELVGGVFLLIGLFSRLASLLLFCVLIGALFTTENVALEALWHHFNFNPFFESTPFLFIYATVIIFCFGPGKFSLDYTFFKQERP